MKNLKVYTTEGDIDIQSLRNREVHIDVESGMLIITNSLDKVVAVFASGYWLSAMAIDERDEGDYNA